jgi:hypothetical protein
MNRNNKQYKKTSNNVTVSRNDLLASTIDVLMQYDSLTPSERNKLSDPYVNPVFAMVDGGKSVQVPRYIQHKAIVKWNIIKNRSMNAHDALEPHTRLSRRNRYSQADPNIMDPELRNIYENTQGSNDDINNSNNSNDDYENDNNYLMYNDISNMNANRKKMIKRIGSARIPDPRYGMGGSTGDLPRNFGKFNDRIARTVDDFPYIGDGSRKRSNRVSPNRFYPKYSQRDTQYLDKSYEQNQRDVGKYIVGGPGSMKYGKSDNEVIGIESDTHAENDVAETVGTEQYAPIDLNEEECTSCGTREDPNDNDNSNGNYDDYDENINLEYNEQEDTYDNTYNDYNNDRSPDGYEEDIYGEDIEDADNQSPSDSDSTYKYLFFLLLLIFVLVVFYLKKENNNSRLMSI